MVDRLLSRGDEVLAIDNLFTGDKSNLDHLAGNPRFEFMRHDVCFPLYVEVDQIFNLACPASPTHYQHDPVLTTKTSVIGAINMLGLAKRLRVPILQASTSGDPHVDASYVKVRQNGRIVSVAVIVAVGVNGDGRREVLGMDIGPSEAESFWTGFLRKLARRGLRGVKLVMSHAHEGINAAISKLLCASWQRCRVHFMRNALPHADKSGRRVVSAFIATAFAQETHEAASQQWRAVANQMRAKLPKLATLMDDAESDAAQQNRSFGRRSVALIGQFEGGCARARDQHAQCGKSGAKPGFGGQQHQSIDVNRPAVAQRIDSQCHPPRWRSHRSNSVISGTWSEHCSQPRVSSTIR